MEIKKLSDSVRGIQQCLFIVIDPTAETMNQIHKIAEEDKKHRIENEEVPVVEFLEFNNKRIAATFPSRCSVTTAINQIFPGQWSSIEGLDPIPPISVQNSPMEIIRQKALTNQEILPTVTEPDIRTAMINADLNFLLKRKIDFNLILSDRVTNEDDLLVMQCMPDICRACIKMKEGMGGSNYNSQIVFFNKVINEAMTLPNLSIYRKTIFNKALLLSASQQD